MFKITYFPLVLFALLFLSAVLHHASATDTPVATEIQMLPPLAVDASTNPTKVAPCPAQAGSPLVLGWDGVNPITCLTAGASMGTPLGVGTSTPQGTLDVENTTNTATICLNGNCTSSIGSVAKRVNISTLNSYHNLCTQGTGFTAGYPPAFSAFCTSACSRYCSTGCPAAWVGVYNCTNALPGLGYTGGTITEFDGTTATCDCF